MTHNVLLPIGYNILGGNKFKICHNVEVVMEFNKPKTEGPRFSVKYVLTKQRVQLTCTWLYRTIKN